jgi:hypothetical protein
MAFNLDWPLSPLQGLAAQKHGRTRTPLDGGGALQHPLRTALPRAAGRPWHSRSAIPPPTLTAIVAP